MRKVMTNAEVVHAWANQTQYEARNGKDSLFFRGNELFSYGYHYRIANLVQDGVVLFNSTKSTKTTETHKSMAYGAVHGRRVFWVPETDINSSNAHKKNLEDYSRRVQMSLEKSVRARKEENKAWHIGQARDTFLEAKDYAKEFECEDLFNEVFPSDDFSNIFSAQDEAGDAIQRMLRARRKLKLKEFEKKVEEFHKGGSVYLVHPEKPLMAYLRVDGDSVVTSKGVRLGKKEARALWSRIQKTRKYGKTFVPTSSVLVDGMYPLKKVTKSGNLHIGCHLIPYKESEAAAKALGFLD